MSDVGEAGNDVLKSEASGTLSDSQRVCADCVNDDEVKQLTGNTDKESVKTEEQEGASVKDSDASRKSSAKQGAEAKNGGNKQPEL